GPDAGRVAVGTVSVRIPAIPSGILPIAIRVLAVAPRVTIALPAFPVASSGASIRAAWRIPTACAAGFAIVAAAARRAGSGGRVFGGHFVLHGKGVCGDARGDRRAGWLARLSLQ